MSRDDSILATGTTHNVLTSPKQQQVLEKQAEARQKRQDTTHKLKPAAEPILALIDKHKTAARNVAAVTNDDTISDKQAGEMLRSQRKIYSFLLTFEAEIKMLLKEDK